MPNCIVRNCGNRTSCKSSKQEALEEQVKISFHRVPKNVTNRRLWLKNLGLEESYIPNDAVVCSLHFNSQDYDRTSLSRLRLKAHAIPYVLKQELNNDFIIFAEPLEEIQRCESPMKSECTLPTNDKGVQTTRLSEDKATCMSPSRQFHSPGKEELRDHAARMKKSYQYEIKILKQKYRRSTIKIQTLEAMVQTLRQKILLQGEHVETLESISSFNSELYQCMRKNTADEFLQYKLIRGVQKLENFGIPENVWDSRKSRDSRKCRHSRKFQEPV